MESIWEHSTLFRRACEERSGRSAPEMDCARQLAEILGTRCRPGMTLLDAGCAAGHYFHTLRPVGIDYFGIDSSPTAIAIGQRNMPSHGLPSSRLRLLDLERLPDHERYDVVVCFNTLMYCPNYHRPLDILTRAARSLLVIRDCFEDRTRYRWEPDILLDEGYQDLCAYFNVWGRAEVRDFIRHRGFSVEVVADRRRRERFGGEPEVVGGIALPYEILVCERTST